jgi:hypothetical protein
MTMTKNPILDELHAVREKLLEDAGGTLDALVDRLQAEEQQSNRPRYQARPTIIGCNRAAVASNGMESRPVAAD